MRYAAGRLRAALRRRPSPRVAIIGAGFGGLAAAVALRRRGIDDLVIIERADGVGGTWRLNTYPGAACDIQSHLYSFSFAPNRNWSRTYARQPEILAYLESVADDFDLRRHLMTETAVRNMRWNSDTSRWDLDLESLATGDGFAYTADVVVSAVGLFGEPKLPDIDGVTDFGGSIMHTSRWDPSIDLAGRRVAVIGTGASAVQAVPEIGKVAAEVTVFQRTPPWMVPKDDRAFTDDQLNRFRRSPFAARRERWRLWKEQHDNTALRRDDPLVAGRQGIAEGFLQRSVADDDLRAALTPDYPFRCKRVLLGGDYYAALQQDNVSLVTEPIDKVTETSVCTAQSTTDVDVIVLATGFQTSHYLSGIDVTGTDGQSLHERWGEDPSAYLGVAVSGFPNFLMLYGPNTNQGGNSIVYILEAGARMVADAVNRLARAGGTLEVRSDAERRFNDEISAELEQTVWTQCGSYYKSPAGRIVTQWPYNELEYARRTWRLRPRDWIHRGAGHKPSGQDPMTLSSSSRAKS
ncbi:cation diffusion facilitator CzcD-associated flavoprotein CzcO [Mycolicibacterium sp. BK556]|uniref:flavin-containing monooxygenase n=1 Tax=unclassified Mycolicibacterium TaxID=2636767 RepID=UPI00161C8A20|nr:MULTISPECIES: NAD(P)/FAD-dependent oxidoreductase [unclassified Mycolicibacterium]MBB3602151.1 cation diffusion facilitator CzcD-associated flavoprotein CzcO [Mycolicibacterium sp. BK556]MBB3631903.1 cation diffusion facilitator CzcD-associated flavoprotein CzcO [Mycolicibacterium sp. BK607]